MLPPTATKAGSTTGSGVAAMVSLAGFLALLRPWRPQASARPVAASFSATAAPSGFILRLSARRLSCLGVMSVGMAAATSSVFGADRNGFRSSTTPRSSRKSTASTSAQASRDAKLALIVHRLNIFEISGDHPDAAKRHIRRVIKGDGDSGPCVPPKEQDRSSRTPDAIASCRPTRISCRAGRIWDR